MKPASRDLKPDSVIRSRHRGPWSIKCRKDDDTGWWINGGGGIADFVFDDPKNGYEVVSVPNDDEVTITVRRRDIGAVLQGIRHFSQPASSAAFEAADRIEAAIGPPWEPSDEQIDALVRAYPACSRSLAAQQLKALHKAGLVLP